MNFTGVAKNGMPISMRSHMAETIRITASHGLPK
jgi:hypothetical protein